MDKERKYIAIDLKSFYASCELMDRGLDALTTNLVVADPSRTEKTICLAVSPSLKAYGIPGRARLFEVMQKVKEINARRFDNARKLGLLHKNPETGSYDFSEDSSNDLELKANPALKLGFIVAPPRMKRYEEISTKIFSIYLRYVSAEDIHVYSIDECFIDVTAYLSTYSCTPRDFAMKIIRDILAETHITATAGIGTNMYLAKIAMDVVAKHVNPDKDGVRIAELTELSYRELLWSHQPITDFWRVGSGIAKRLANYGIYTMGDIAQVSVTNEDLLYKEFGVNAELLIDHAWGWEPTDISTIKSYKPLLKSLSSGQVLHCPYTADKAKLIVKEMTELLVLDLVRKNLVTKKVELTIGYDRNSIELVNTGNNKSSSSFKIQGTNDLYKGKITLDRFGRPLPYHAHGTANIDGWTSSTKAIMNAMVELYDRIIDPALLVRRINIVACDLISSDAIPQEAPYQMNLFTDYGALEKEKAAKKAADEKEKKLQMATLSIIDKFGKNALLKGMNLEEDAMTIKRNKQVGGHSSGE